MPRVCTICAHPERDAIDAALLGGESFRTIAHRLSVSLDALKRHKRDHLPEHLSKAARAAEAADATDLLGQMADLHRRTLAILKLAEGAGDGRMALMAVREARGNLELLGKLSHQLDTRPTVNIMLAPEWLVVRAALLDALRVYPEARAAVAGRLLSIEAGAGTVGGI